MLNNRRRCFYGVKPTAFANDKNTHEACDDRLVNRHEAQSFLMLEEVHDLRRLIAEIPFGLVGPGLNVVRRQAPDLRSKIEYTAEVENNLPTVKAVFPTWGE